MSACATCLRLRILIGAGAGIILLALVAPGLLARLAAGMPTPATIAGAILAGGTAALLVRLALWRGAVRDRGDG